MHPEVGVSSTSVLKQWFSRWGLESSRGPAAEGKALSPRVWVLVLVPLCRMPHSGPATIAQMLTLSRKGTINHSAPLWLLFQLNDLLRKEDIGCQVFQKLIWDYFLSPKNFSQQKQNLRHADNLFGSQHPSQTFFFWNKSLITVDNTTVSWTGNENLKLKLHTEYVSFFKIMFTLEPISLGLRGLARLKPYLFVFGSTNILLLIS